MKKIHILSPAKSIYKSHIDFAVQFLSEKGFEVDIGEHAAGQNNYFSGTDDERFSDFQKALDDDSVDVILCSRGGYGSVRIIDRLDFSKFREHPKLIMGYSDVTIFHNHINANFGLPSVHSTAPLNFQENTNESLESFLNVLNTKENNYEFGHSPLNRAGHAEAEVIGGNLSILCSLIGTNSDIDYANKILFIEDSGEAVYSVDRMMLTLKKAGRLEGLKGLMVGGLTEMKDSEIPFGMTVEEVIKQSVEEYDFPVCFNFPAGHINDNRAIGLGRTARLEVGHIINFFQSFERS
ncbi:LD-carboxypeptidase [Crocinitomix catalasitica]|nr:LD-carboxypeptidase [Crocinitomix catalasitica]